MLKTQIIFLFTGRVQLTPIKQTDNNLSQTYKLSTVCLTDTQVRVLSKGLKFTLTTRRNTIKIEKRYS